MIDSLKTQNPIVFVVDDEELVRYSLKRVFESEDMEVRTFGSANEFLDAYPEGQVGCLITDVCMPKMTGLELQDEMNRRSIDLPVIVITGYGNIEMAVEAMKIGAVDFIEKPISTDGLLDLTQTAIALSHNKRRQKDLTGNARDLLALLTPR